MAVIPTGALYNTLTFGGVNSGTYGIYITGEGVYNSPERAVELTAVPGRNGAVPVDLGRWENIEVIYKASTGQDSQVDFRTAVADFRNAIGSLRGYQRLEDTYHPDEFRMGLFISGLDVEPEAGGITGEFEIRFNCKPQRFLTSGETAVAVANNGTITNPTALDAKPILEVEGYGDVTIAGQKLTIQDGPLGNIQLAPSVRDTGRVATLGVISGFPDDLTNNGDPIVLHGASIYAEISTTKDIDTTQPVTVSLLATPLSYTASAVAKDLRTIAVSIDVGDTNYTGGSAFSYMLSFTVSATATDSTTGSSTANGWLAYSPHYVPDIAAVTWIPTISQTGFLNTITDPQTVGLFGEVTAVSSVSALGNPSYIDCEIGECYRMLNGSPFPLNGLLSLGAELPVLVPGSNLVKYDLTVTDFKIVPRWWKL